MLLSASKVASRWGFENRRTLWPCGKYSLLFARRSAQSEPSPPACVAMGDARAARTETPTRVARAVWQLRPPQPTRWDSRGVVCESSLPLVLALAPRGQANPLPRRAPTSCPWRRARAADEACPPHGAGRATHAARGESTVRALSRSPHGPRPRPLCRFGSSSQRWGARFANNLFTKRARPPVRPAGRPSWQAGRQFYLAGIWVFPCETSVKTAVGCSQD